LAQSRSPRSGQALLVVVAVVGLNLRPFITGVGPLARDIAAETGLGLQGMSLLTLVPMALMGLVAFVGPALQGALGARRAIVGALAVIGAGSALRLCGGAGWALIGTAAIIGLGVAVVQAVFPGVVKRMFPGHVAKVMGLYSAMIMGGGAVGAKLSPMVAGWSDWRMGLAWLALPAALALVLALLYLPADERAAPSGGVATVFLRRPRAWLLMAFFGLINGGYTTVVAWMSPAYQALGWSGAASGGLLAVMAVAQTAAAFGLPQLIGREGDRRAWLWLTMALQAVGFAGLGFWPQLAPYLWATAVGAGLGGCFAISMVVALDHLSEPAEAGALSALMQGGGFLIAGVAPWIVAVLHDLTGGFFAGWMLHLAMVVFVAALTRRLAPHTYATTMPPLGRSAVGTPATAGVE
jgi:CP family cyanate transporter-like MFS transporter